MYHIIKKGNVNMRRFNKKPVSAASKGTKKTYQIQVSCDISKYGEYFEVEATNFQEARELALKEAAKLLYVSAASDTDEAFESDEDEYSLDEDM